MGWAWINVYPTPLSKMHFPDSPRNAKYCSWVWRSNCNFQEAASVQGFRDIPGPYKVEFAVFLLSHLFNRTIAPATLSKLALSSIRDLCPLGWKIPLSSSTLCPVTKACYSWWWQIKLQFYNTKWRTLPTVLAPPGVIHRQTVHNLPQTGTFPLSKSKLLPCDGKCLFFCGRREKKLHRSETFVDGGSHCCSSSSSESYVTGVSREGRIQSLSAGRLKNVDSLGI